MKRFNCWMLVFAFGLASPAHSQELRERGEEEGIAFFEQNVRPIFVRHCYECHSQEFKQKAGLTLDTREGLLAGGDNGPSVVPGASNESLLIQAVKQVGDIAMPPEEQLTDSQIQVLEKWIDMGAPYPKHQPPVRGITQRLNEAKHHWAFRPLSLAPLPSVQQIDWIRNDIDRFVLAKLETLGAQPSEPADRRALLRRVTLDLIGMIPTPEEFEAFEQDNSPQAYERVVDRLLASPHYGERWGRHWLDLARYADSSGFHNDLDRPWAWKYRDYVIQSFNEDKPYARFVSEQLAGDEVADANDITWIATGFGRNGPSNDDNMGKTEAALKQYRADQLDDVISTTSTVFLGVTIGCARCHDHKTDPFTTQDYYRLLAIFNGTQEFGETPSNKPAKDKESSNSESQKKQMQARIETSAKVPTTYVMRRGLATNVGEEVGPGVPQAIRQDTLAFPEPSDDAKTSLRRITFANWITAKDNPLSWRVLANRIWQHHFGRGIVATPSNFGFSGAFPTHPELLDYLANQLIEDGGRWKPLHKRIVMSATYQQSSRPTSWQIEFDPENQWLSRMPLRRMEAEVIRDSILVASGKLNRAFSGPGIKPRLPAELIPASQRNKWPLIEEEQGEHWRRSVYIYAKRQLLLPMMELFDAPTTTDSCAVRTQSVVPTQALVLMNDSFGESHAAYLAERALRECDGEIDQAIDRVFLLTLGELPSDERLEQARQFVRDRQAVSDTASGLADLAHVLFNSSQFLHIP